VSWTTRHRARGRLSSVATTGIPASPASVSYEYDTAGRLASAGKEQFGYDAAGDLTTPPGGPQQQYNALGELESGNGSSYTYNDEGDLTSAAIDGGAPQSLSYNQAGELTSYQSGTASASYSYNGEGLLASTTVNGFATGYTWDLSQADQELLAAGSTSYNIYGPDGQPVEQVTGSTATFLIADQQGNTRLLTSKTGTVVGTYSYGPYGTAAYSCPRGQDEGCITTALLYGGQYTDGASGDPYLDGRHYDPATGQFLAPAPATVGASAPYALAGDDPVNNNFTGLTWDPVDHGSGSSMWEVIAGITLAVLLGFLLGVLPGGAVGEGYLFFGTSSLAGAEDVEAGAATGIEAEAGSGIDAVQLNAVAEGDISEAAGDVANDEETAEYLTDEDEDPVTSSQETIDTEAEADDVDGQQAPQSCWAVPGANAACRTMLAAQLEKVSVGNLLGFIFGSINAAQTCSDPHRSTLDCVEKAGETLTAGLGIKKKGDD
jgi:RHS repeat-associated protein